MHIMCNLKNAKKSIPSLVKKNFDNFFSCVFVLAAVLSGYWRTLVLVISIQRFIGDFHHCNNKQVREFRRRRKNFHKGFSEILIFFKNMFHESETDEAQSSLRSKVFLNSVCLEQPLGFEARLIKQLASTSTPHSTKHTDFKFSWVCQILVRWRSDLARM